MIIHDIEQRSEAWHEIRLGRVTGTRFKNLVSKPSTASYQDLVRDIASEIVTGKEDESYVNENMERGMEMEPVAVAEYESIFGVTVMRPGFITPDEDHPYYEWVGISPDGLLPDGGGLEIKCPLMKTHFEYLTGGSLPSEYRHQVQGALFVTGLKYWDFMSYAEGMKPFVIRVYPDEELFAEYRARLDILIEEVKKLIKEYENYNVVNE